MRPHTHYSADEHGSSYADDSSFMESISEALASGMGNLLLNLVFSAVAFYTGALVIIAQKAQTRTDKANEESGRQAP